MHTTTKSCFTGVVALFLLLNFCPQAHAQSAPAAQPPGPGTQPPAAPVLSSYAAAHDSLLHRVARARNRAEARISSFKATQGSFGGLHRKVTSYAGAPRMLDAGGKQSSPLVVKRQTIVHRNGIELEKIVYRDAKGRKFLTERYEGHQLTRLELFEFDGSFGTAVGNWLLVRGDYLRYTLSPVSATNNKQQSYFFRPRPGSTE